MHIRLVSISALCDIAGVSGDAKARIMGSENDRNGLVDAIVGHLLNRLFDEWMSVLRSHVELRLDSASGQSLPDQLSLTLRNRSERRRASDRFVTVDEVLQLLLGRGTAMPDVRV